MKYQGQTQTSMTLATKTNINLNTYLHTSPHIFTNLQTSSHISTHLHKSSNILTHLHTSPHISTHLHTSSHIFTPWRWQPVRLGCQRTWGRAWERALQEIWSIQELCIPLPQTWRSWNASEKLPQKSQGIKCTQLSQHISPFLNLSEPHPHLSLITIAPYCTRTQSHLYILLPAWQSPRSKSKIIQHPTTACGFGSCHASAQPRVGAWRRPGHRLRRGQGGPRSPPEAAPWNQRFHAFAGAWRKSWHLTFVASSSCDIALLFGGDGYLLDWDSVALDPTGALGSSGSSGTWV